MQLTEAGWSIIRNNLFKTGLTQSQVEGIYFILDYQKNTKVVRTEQIAYVLSTIHHETAATFKPIEEFGKGRGKSYGKRLKMDKKTFYTNTPNLFYGRGFVQVTWYENYEKLTALAKAEGHDWDFLNHPELMLQPEPSIWAAFKGMEIGLFTGVRLANYFNYERTDFVNARRIINGMDKAELIAGYAVIYNIALQGK